VGSNRLGVLNGAAVLQVGSDARGAERVTASGCRQPCREGPAFDHAEHVGPGHRIIGKLAALVYAAEERTLLLVSDAGSCEVGVHVGIGVVVGRHFVPLEDKAAIGVQI
jgi:hypothetical protein